MFERQITYLKEDHKKIENSKICIVGLGSLGSSVAELLTRSGVKHLTLIDRDVVEPTNLQSQHLYTQEDINKPKTESIKTHLKKINPDINLNLIFDHLNFENINIEENIIIDCTDNLETRFLLNEYTLKNNKTLIHASCIRNQGNIYIITKDRPCLQCFLKEANLETCQSAGVLNTIPTLISSLAVSETIKIITNKPFEKNLININLETNEFTKIKVNKNENCPSKNYNYLKGEKDRQLIKFCSSNTYLIKHDKEFNELKTKLDPEIDLKTAFIINNITFFKDKVLI